MFDLIETEVSLTNSIIDVLSVIISLGLFILKGFAVYYMSKKAGLKKLWMSFTPFLNFILLGKIIGKSKVWGISIKNIGLWLCIMSAVQTVFSAMLNVGYYVDSFIYTLEGFGVIAKISFSSTFFEGWYVLTGGTIYKSAISSATLQSIEAYAGLVVFILDIVIWLAYAFFEIHFLLLLFKKYAPQNLTMFTILCIFIPEALGVILFIYRKKEPFDYDAYMQSRARYTYYNRGFGGNPYNNSYYNPNNHSYESNQPADVDPFPEFSSSSKNDVGSDNPFGTEGFGQDS